MTNRPFPLAVRSFRVAFMLCVLLVISVQVALAAPFASLVMDARTGEVLQSSNADTRLHPASLTKMMTLYIAFEAIKKGEISLDTVVTVSAKAANEQPSKLGLKAGQKIQLRYLIRAAAIKSANDCATAIGEAIGGSEANFAKRMNRTAKALGMTHTTFKNANGLTEAGHLSTARDMAILGRHLIYDHPEYYNLFSRRSADAGGRTVNSTNARFLDAYEGADGIKTGYTVAAGFNLVASAQRGNTRIIAAVFGGTSTAARNAKVAELLDFGFRKAPSNARTKTPPAPDYRNADADVLVAEAGPAAGKGVAAKTLRVSGAVIRSPHPRWRAGPAVPVPSDELLATIQDGVAEALEAVAEEDVAAAPTDLAPVVAAPAPPRPDKDSDAAMALGLKPGDPLLAVLDAADAPAARLDAVPVEVALAAAPQTDAAQAEAAAAAVEAAIIAEARLPADAAAGIPVVPGPAVLAADAPAADRFPVPPADAQTLIAEAQQENPAADDDELALLAEADESTLALTPVTPLPAEAGAPIAGAAGPGAPDLLLASIEPESFDDGVKEPVIVARLSTSGGRHWGINVGSYPSQYEAERVLLVTALKEVGTLGDSKRNVLKTRTGFDANFTGMTRDMAELACQRLVARNLRCVTLGG
jgi:D-alanyl-D-alanine carboxypeptidase